MVAAQLVGQFSELSCVTVLGKHVIASGYKGGAQSSAYAATGAGYKDIT